MAQRPIWRGHLRLALVSCPVTLYSVKHDRETIHFHLINPATGHRVRMITQDAETEEEVSRRDLMKGYEFRKNHFLLLNPEDFESVRVESSDMIVVEKFVQTTAIDPIYWDSAYYVAPDGPGRDIYAVLYRAMLQTGRMAISRVVIGQRERTVVLRTMAGGIVAQVLYEPRDINDAASVFEDLESIETDPEMVKLAVQLIDRQTGKFDPADMEDRYETRLRAMIDARLKGEGINLSAVPEPSPPNVVNLMDALRKSLESAAPSNDDDRPVGQNKAAAPKKRASRSQARSAGRKALTS